MPLHPIQINTLALHNCIARAGLPPAESYDAAIAWAGSSWVNTLEVQAEALRLAGLPLPPDIYQAALESAMHQDIINFNNRNN